MSNYVVVLFFAMVILAAAKPLPENDQGGQEILNGADTRYYGYGLPAFWFRRPLTDDNADDYGGDDGGYARPENHRHQSSVPLYANSGAGWGR